MTDHYKTQIGLIAAALVISVAITGFFVGLQSPMKSQGDSTLTTRLQDSSNHDDHAILPAAGYRELATLDFGPNKDWQTSLAMLQPSAGDPLATITISPQQKSFALAVREKNRAFNGAPPTVPHPIDQMSATTCAACHTKGVQTASLRIPRMSHPLMENCTQCHVESNPKHMPANEFSENSFIGLPAPVGGPRAYPHAPPQIPHSVWMRNDCLSCHGPSGNFGIRTTHPWRTNCQQCHAPSSELNQIQLDPKPQFLPPLKIDN